MRNVSQSQHARNALCVLGGLHMKPIRALSGAALLLGTSMLAAQAQTLAPTTPPDPTKFEAQTSPDFVGVKDILEFKALDAYSEPDWVTEQFVKTGKLPPVAERLPAGTDGLQDRQHDRRHRRLWRRHAPCHRRPPAGLELCRRPDQGWGGVDIGMYECLTRTGRCSRSRPPNSSRCPTSPRAGTGRKTVMN